MKQHISSLCHTMFLALRRITSIHLFLANSSTAKFVVSLIMSRLDYCSATFAGVANEQIAHIQKIQKNDVQLCLKESKRGHVTPLLKTPHWLPVKYHIEYKLTVLASVTLIALFHHACLLFSASCSHSFFDRTTAENSKDKFENLW